MAFPKKEKHIPSHGQFVAQRAGEETEWAGIPVDGPASRSRLQLWFHGMPFVYSVSMCYKSYPLVNIQKAMENQNL